MYYFHFAHPQIFYLFVPLWALITLYRWKFYRSPRYTYPLTGALQTNSYVKRRSHKAILFFLRSGLLLSLIFLIARPQWVDARSKINIEGVDIMITLDVSGSMQVFDSMKDRRQRIDVAKQEAINFIQKRPDDPIGIVIFGADAISRCPLTLDKTILIQIIRETKLGIISPQGTSLGTGLATAINKLKNKQSSSKNKIIILLTDGQPTPETEQVSVETALELAKKFNIKIYTIAIGNKKGGYISSSFGFIQQVRDSINESLLQKIAQQTDGKFFRANNPQEMRTIYDIINRLEKTKRETNLFSRYHEAFAAFIWIILLLLFSELLLKLFIWRGIT